MEINERDYGFMLKVQEAYEKSRDGEVGSIRAVATAFGMSRTKVRKILITLDAIESTITEEALRLKAEGKSLEEIADELGCSKATVSTYLPYDTVIYNGEEKSPGAIRHEKYRERNKLAAGNQVQRNKKTREDWNEPMKEREHKVLKLRLTLDIDGANMEALRKYGKVKDGITRDILVPADINLHALHYVIQKAFGWQNSHLHHFRLPEKTFDALTQDSFLKWADYCGLYFRFPSEDMEEIYWDDDYDESVSVKTWLRRKYTGTYRYRGRSEHFMEARTAVSEFCDDNRMMRGSPSFSEWMHMSEAEKENLQKHPRIKKIEDVTCEEMQEYFAEEGGLDELLERLKVTEILGTKAKAGELKKLVREAAERFDNNNTDAPNEYAYWKKMTELNGEVLPLTKELVYEYDYGDGWEVKVELVEEYDGVEDTESELRDQIAAVITKHRPLCIALDGLPVLDDVGGIGGYCKMLTGIHGEGSAHFDYDDPEETREWARMQGWTGRLNKPATLL